jgi:hypothetical protein
MKLDAILQDLTASNSSSNTAAVGVADSKREQLASATEIKEISEQLKQVTDRICSLKPAFVKKVTEEESIL